MDEIQHAFLAKLREDRYDQTTRLVYADWLDEHDMPELADIQRQWTPEFQKSVDWLEEFSRECRLPYQDLMDMAQRYLETGEEVDAPFDVVNGRMFDDGAEFWDHYERVTKEKLPVNRTRLGFMHCDSCNMGDWEDQDEGSCAC